jgi:hypothetical protein
MIGFCESLAIDGPVEIVNERELTEVEAIGVQLFAINVSVGLALQIPGVRESVACSLVQKLPFGAGSIVGVRSMGEARQVRAAGADAIMVKKEVRRRPLCIGNTVLVKHASRVPGLTARERTAPESCSPTPFLLRLHSMRTVICTLLHRHSTFVLSHPPPARKSHAFTDECIVA